MRAPAHGPPQQSRRAADRMHPAASPPIARSALPAYHSATTRTWANAARLTAPPALPAGRRAPGTRRPAVARSCRENGVLLGGGGGQAGGARARPSAPRSRTALRASLRRWAALRSFVCGWAARQGRRRPDDMHMFKAGQKRSQQSGLRRSRRSLRGGFGVPKDSVNSIGSPAGGIRTARHLLPVPGFRQSCAAGV